MPRGDPRPRLWRNQSGTSLIEFALVAPILILLLIGGFQLLDAISAYRKVTATTRALADMTTQSSHLTYAQADSILNAARHIMTPYSTARATLRISQIEIPVTGAPKVNWSRALHTSSRAVDSGITLSDKIQQPSTWLIYSEMTFQYTPKFASSVIGSITFHDELYMAPRRSASIPIS